MPTMPLLIWGAQTVLLFLFVADRWVHGITGKAPMEARIVELEKSVSAINDKASDNNTRYMDKINVLELNMREAQTNIKHNSTEILVLQTTIARFQSGV